MRLGESLALGFMLILALILSGILIFGAEHRRSLLELRRLHEKVMIEAQNENMNTEEDKNTGWFGFFKSKSKNEQKPNPPSEFSNPDEMDHPQIQDDQIIQPEQMQNNRRVGGFLFWRKCYGIVPHVPDSDPSDTKKSFKPTFNSNDNNPYLGYQRNHHNHNNKTLPSTTNDSDQMEALKRQLAEAKKKQELEEKEAERLKKKEKELEEIEVEREKEWREQIEKESEFEREKHKEIEKEKEKLKNLNNQIQSELSRSTHQEPATHITHPSHQTPQTSHHHPHLDSFNTLKKKLHRPSDSHPNRPLIFDPIPSIFPKVFVNKILKEREVEIIVHGPKGRVVRTISSNPNDQITNK